MSNYTISPRTAELFDLTHTLARPWLSRTEYPWEILSDISAIIREIGDRLDPNLYDHPADGIWIAKSATVAPTAYIGAPTVIGENTEVRHGAFIRGSALVGDGCVVGNSCELKNCILFDGVQVPHYNYVGDSILGHKSHMGAGAITSNVKSDKSPVTVKPAAGYEGAFEPIPTGRKKCGAMLGDFVEVGCNSVLNPGTVIGSHSNVYPLSSVRGVVPAHAIFKSGKGSEIVEKE
ncbi:MAG: UDP-N-acetylglucosamine pyrophosphorylase [Clostridia bacterium]|nr:UDP-N-acetylglucosamine pyrophosphorylase [Clostridia bacterium]